MYEVYLNFHGLGAPPRGINAEERPYWLTSERFSCILSLAQRYDPAQCRIHITLDDGNRSDATVALPILQEFKRHVSFFLLSDAIGKPGFVDEYDIARLHAAGMTIGSHGAAHVRWTTLDAAEVRKQVKDSLRILSGLVGEPVNRVAVPFGAYNRRVLSTLRQLGVTVVFTSDGGLTTTNAWVKARNTIRMDTPLETIEVLLSGRLSPLQQLRFFARRLFRRLS